MITKPTLKEARADLEQTNRDIDYLQAIITNLRAFVQNDTGRENSRFDLFVYETYLRQGESLKTRIEQTIKSLE